MSTLPRYVRPSITRHRAGLMNKMGGGPALRPVTELDGVRIADLVEAYGSPLFVYSEATLRKRVRDLRQALEKGWPKVVIAWSYKTCYLDAVCRVFHDEGSWAEGVSGMELDKAARNGVPPTRMVFNGPHKDEAHLEAALRDGALVHIDHFDEIAMAERIARRLDRKPEVGIRLNLAAGALPRWDRFGFNLENGQAWDAVRRIVGGGHLTLAGLHLHLGTFVLDVDAYREAAGKVAELANRLRSELGITVRWLDLGGGFASNARLKSQYLPAETVTPSLAQYAEALCDGLSALDLPHDQVPTLIVETGRALVDDAGSLVATVVANKRLADGRRSIVLDAGVNVLFTSNWYKHDIVPCQPTPGVPEPTVVFGPLCMNIDVVCEHLMLPPLEVGDRVLIRPVGAYNVTQSMQFIHLRPAVVMVGPGRQHGVIQRQETLDDLVAREQIPTWLGGKA